MKWRWFAWMALAFLLIEIAADIHTTGLPLYHWIRFARAALIVAAFRVYATRVDEAA